MSRALVTLFTGRPKTLAQGELTRMSPTRADDYLDRGIGGPRVVTVRSASSRRKSTLLMVGGNGRRSRGASRSRETGNPRRREVFGVAMGIPARAPEESRPTPSG